MPTGNSNYPALVDSWDTSKPNDADLQAGGLSTDGAFHRDARAAVVALQTVVGATTNPDSASLVAKATANAAAISALQTRALDAFGAPTDVTTLNVSTSAHGLMPKLDGAAGHVLNGQGAWVNLAGGGDMLRSVYDVNLDGIVDVAASANAVAYANVTGRPTLGTSAAKDIAASGNASTLQVVYGTDTRLSDSRTPSAHAPTHRTGGSDAIALDTLAAPTDVTTLNASTGAHGLAPKLPSPTATSIYLVWSPIPLANITGYTIHYGTSSGTYTLTQTVGLVTSAYVTGLTTGTTYYFVVNGFDGVGNLSANSSEVSAIATTTPINFFRADGQYAPVSYPYLSQLPTLGTASSLNVPASGNATSGQVVLGSDTRLSGVSSGTKTINRFDALQNHPPTANYAVFNTRNGLAMLDFDATTAWAAVFLGVVPDAAVLTGGLVVKIHWLAASATSGNVVWAVKIDRGTTGIGIDSYDTPASVTSAPNATNTTLTVSTITVSTIDSIAVGDLYKLNLYRDKANAADTMAGNASLFAVEVRTP